MTRKKVQQPMPQPMPQTAQKAAQQPTATTPAERAAIKASKIAAHSAEKAAKKAAAKHKESPAFVQYMIDNLVLTIAIFASIIVHVCILAWTIINPPPVPEKTVDTGLEVILVNAKHDKEPVKADALAQANLEGGGESDVGRVKSPLPNSRQVEDGDSLKVAQRKIEEIEDNQRKLLDRIKSEDSNLSRHDSEKNSPNEVTNNRGKDDSDSEKSLKRRIAEISQTIEEQNKRPRKTMITPSTRKVGYASYYKSLQKRVEEMGTLNFPKKNGEKFYGSVIVYVPIFQDGTIYEKEGGPKVERSSGNKILDAAALRAVRLAAPFAKFPPEMRSRDKDDVWAFFSKFNFTHEDQLETELKGESK